MLASCWISIAHFLLAGTYFTGLIGVHISGVICMWSIVALLTNKFHFENSVQWRSMSHQVALVPHL